MDGSERLGDLHEEVPVEAERVEQTHLLLVVADENVVAVVPEKEEKFTFFLVTKQILQNKHTNEYKGTSFI